MNRFRKQKTGKNGMTLMEIMIVVSLISLTSLAIYQALSSGISIWKRNLEMDLEQDVVVFFEKLSEDLRNAYVYSKFPFSGDGQQLAFPTIVYSSPDRRLLDEKQQWFDQPGKVQYYFDVSKDALFRRQANYGQAFNEFYDQPRVMVPSVERISFQYLYLTENGEMVSHSILEGIPSGIEVEITLNDQRGKRVMRRLFDVPIGT